MKQSSNQMAVSCFSDDASVIVREQSRATSCLYRIVLLVDRQSCSASLSASFRLETEKADSSIHTRQKVHSFAFEFLTHICSKCRSPIDSGGGSNQLCLEHDRKSKESKKTKKRKRVKAQLTEKTTHFSAAFSSFCLNSFSNHICRQSTNRTLFPSAYLCYFKRGCGLDKHFVHSNQFAFIQIGFYFCKSNQSAFSSFIAGTLLS